MFINSFVGALLLRRNDYLTPNIPMDRLQETPRNLISANPQGVQISQTLGQQIIIASITVLGGFIVYVAGQIFTKFLIDPINEQKQIIGKIADALIFYANKYYSIVGYDTSTGFSTLWSSSEEREQTKKVEEENKKRNNLISDTIRSLGTQLLSKTYIIPYYGFFAKLGLVKTEKNIIAAQHGLMGLSNMVGDPDWEMRAKFEKEIRVALGLFDPNKN